MPKAKSRLALLTFLYCIVEFVKTVPDLWSKSVAMNNLMANQHKMLGLIDYHKQIGETFGQMV